MTNPLSALQSSVEHLRAVIEGYGDLNPNASAYPTEWSIADTMSHIGSGAVISLHNFNEVIEEREGEPGFNQSVWDEWNAKSPTDQVKDALTANDALILALEALPQNQRSTFHTVMGPFDLDFNGFVALRLGEQALHTWDVEVALDPTATLSDDVAEVILEGIARLVGFTGKANGETREFTVRTTNPARDFTIVFATDSVSMATSAHTGNVDLELPAEAFVRLVYGRLDEESPSSHADDDTLKALRAAFPGF